MSQWVKRDLRLNTDSETVVFTDGSYYIHYCSENLNFQGTLPTGCSPYDISPSCQLWSRCGCECRPILPLRPLTATHTKATRLLIFAGIC